MTAARAAAARWGTDPIRTRVCDRLISYCRLSVKKGRNGFVELESEAIDRQRTNNQRRAARDGHTIVFDLVDDGLSAYDETVTREAWETALDLIRTGQADGFLAWNEDRMVRQPIDAIHLMNAAKAAGIPVLEGDSKVWDFTDSTDEFMFLLGAGLGKKSSADTSRRVLDKQAKNREKGRMSGRSAYGFMHDPTMPGGPRVVNPAEAEVIREVARRVLAGETWKAILDDLAARGVQTHDAGELVKGRPFTRTTMRAALLAPRMAGLLVHKGEVVGVLRDAEGKPQQPILDRETWERVCSELKGRSTGAPRQTRFLLSGLLACGRCGNVMTSVETRSNGLAYRVYKCRGDSDNAREGRPVACSVTIMGGPAEEVVRDAVLAWQSDPTRLAAMTEADAVVDAKVADLQAQLDRLLAISKRNAAKLEGGIWDAETYDRFDGPNDKRIVELKAEMQSLSQPSVLRDLAVDTLTKSWATATDDERRAMIRVALRSVTVLPATVKGGGGRDPRARVVCDPR